MLQKIKNVFEKSGKGILLGALLAIITILVINLLDSQKEFAEFKNSKSISYFWNNNTYKNNNSFSELFILKNTDLINNIRSVEFNNNIERVEISAINGKDFNKIFNYEISSTKKNVIKNITLRKNTIILDIIPNVGIAKIKIGFKKNFNINDLRKEDQILIKVSHYHTAD